VTAGLAKSVTNGRSVAQRAGYPRSKVTGTPLTGSFRFTAQFWLKNRAAGAAKFCWNFSKKREQEKNHE